MKASSEANKPPMLGQPWPGQGGTYAGLIRGDDGEYHLIAATDDAGKLKGKWASHGTSVVGAGSKTDGFANTQAMADAGSELAKAAQAVEIEGHKDFYLPSRVELSLIRANASESFDKEWHWSSTQFSANSAWAETFLGGYSSYTGQDCELRARAVRQVKGEGRMKPFDLEAALAGAPVVTRDGRAVTQLMKFRADDSHLVFGVLSGTASSWHDNGLYFSNKADACDLFMKPFVEVGIDV